ncbi:MAG: sialidase family protein [Bryobacterales bacterium]|nr:sialidase family protein [Bryobacterales bacterium]
MLDRRCFLMGAGLEFLSVAAFPQDAGIGGFAADSAGLACGYEVSPKGLPNEGILFVDHSRAGRGGHLGYALVEYEDGKILAFYPNCSAESHNPENFPMALPVKGHSARGWMEYKRSDDGGRTWNDPKVLPYSKNLFDAEQSGKTDKRVSALAEKAIRTADGDIVLFFLVCDITNNVIYWQCRTPTYIVSADGGHTWSEPSELCDDRGRIYDARYYNGEIFVLHFKNDNEIEFLGNKKEHVYGLYVSADGGRSFAKRSELPFDTAGRLYGTMGVLDSDRLVVYIYNSKAEDTMDYVVSDDGGRTWSDPKIAQFQKRIRNPQMALLNGCYFMHGRSGGFGDEEGKGHFTLYSSRDGLTWDAGVYLRMRTAGLGAYSNSIVVGSLNASKRKRLLIQASHAYEDHLTNVYHWWLDTPGEKQ